MTKIKSLLFLLLLTAIAVKAQNLSIPCPCCTPEHRQFDFWLGSWMVYTSDTLAGTNNITLSQDSCLIIEHWKSARGKFTGTSYNFYDTGSGSWHQTWVDNQGGNLLLKGGFKDGKMVMTSEPAVDANGIPVINRITWTRIAGGHVRQVWEISKNNGNSWVNIFDGLYMKKNPGN